jgi:hypothetical protein
MGVNWGGSAELKEYSLYDLLYDCVNSSLMTPY